MELILYIITAFFFMSMRQKFYYEFIKNSLIDYSSYILNVFITALRLQLGAGTVLTT